MTFTDTLRAAFGQETAILDEVQGAIDGMHALKRTQIYIPTFSPVFAARGRIPVTPIRTIGLAHMGLLRAIDFALAMQRNCNSFAYAPVYSDCRSLLEVAALLDDMQDRMARFIGKPSAPAHAELVEHLDAVVLGFKSQEWRPTVAEAPAIQSKNILTLIDRVDKRIGGVRSAYDFLSEVAHPNYMGMARAYQEIAENFLTITFHERPAERDPQFMREVLGISTIPLTIVLRAVQAIEADFETFALAVASVLQPPVQNGEPRTP